MRGRKRKLSNDGGELPDAKAMRHEDEGTTSRSVRIRKMPAKLLDDSGDALDARKTLSFDDDDGEFHPKSMRGRGRGRRGRPPKTPAYGSERPAAKEYNKLNTLLFDYHGDDDFGYSESYGDGYDEMDTENEESYDSGGFASMFRQHQQPIKLKLSKVKTTTHSHSTLWKGADSNDVATDEEPEPTDSEGEGFGHYGADEDEDIDVEEYQSPRGKSRAFYNKPSGRGAKRGRKPKHATMSSFLSKSQSAPRSQSAAEKRKRRVTAYVMFCNDSRSAVQDMYPTLDFGEISKKLGDMWNQLPANEQMKWKRKAKKEGGLGSTLISTGGLTQSVGMSGALMHKSPVELSEKVAQKILALEQAAHNFRVTGCRAIDVAAHLLLLGDSLSTIGSRLVEHKGQIAVSGSLHVLLDSILCALGSLMCLTREVPVLRPAISDSVHCATLDNLAYLMPGLG